MTKNVQMRQGDVFLEKVEAVPDGATAVEGLVLAEGEQTGHAHRVRGGRAKLFEAAGERFLRVAARATLRHEEHSPVALPRGVYRVAIQREYHPSEIRTVAD